MLPKDDLVGVRHMLDATTEALGYVAGRTRSDLDTDSMLARALINCLSVIGEAAARVRSETQERDAHIPWAQIVGMRNRLIHAYFDIDPDEVWMTVTEDLADRAGMWTGEVRVQ